MKKILFIALLMISISLFSQNEIDWTENVDLQLSDIQSKATKIGEVNIYSLQSGVNMEFAFHMSSMEFMFKKDFNSCIKTIFIKSAACIVAPDSATAENLLSLQNFQFDLNELYSRKFRKRIYEEKATFSSSDYFMPIFNEIQIELNERIMNISNETDLGRNTDLLQKFHNEVLLEIKQYDEFCYSCKLKKKKKTRKNKTTD